MWVLVRSRIYRPFWLEVVVSSEGPRTGEEVVLVWMRWRDLLEHSFLLLCSSQNLYVN